MKDDLRLGVIADDYTGASDVAAALHRQGVTTSLVFGDPTGLPPASTQAIVVALKTRTAPVDQAVAASLSALRWLRVSQMETIYVKYCSTFDSTSQGNIGPVVDAVLDLVGCAQTVICPASPEHGRTTYQGHLFVHDRLLSDSSMAHHPLTPMGHSDLRRLLQPQTPHTVGLIAQPVVSAGPLPVRRALDDLAAQGVRHVVVDALDEQDLDALAHATSHLPVLTGGAGLAGAIARVRRETVPGPKQRTDPPAGRAIIVAGSCSLTTLAQVNVARTAMPSHRIDPLTGKPEALMADILRFLDEHQNVPRVLVYSSADAAQRRRVEEAGSEVEGAVLEAMLAKTAAEAVRRGARRVIVAGGETSGAVVNELGVRIVEVDAEEAQGVPWCLCLTSDPQPLALLLKSGNFGDEQLLERASA